MDYLLDDFGMPMPDPQLTQSDRYATPEEILWLREQIGLHDIPRQLIADAIDVHPTIVSKILHGSRKLKRLEFGQARAAVLHHVSDPAKALSQQLNLVAASTQKIADHTRLSPDRIRELREKAGEPPTTREIRTLKGFFALTPDPRDALSHRDPLYGEYLRAIKNTDMPARALTAATVNTDIVRGQITVLAGLRPVGDGFFADDLFEAERRVIPMVDEILGATGLIIAGDLLAPRFEDGEVILLHPSRPARIGQWAFVQDGQGRIAIGKVLGRDFSWIELDVLRTEKPLKVDLTHHAARVSMIFGVWSE